MKRFLAVLSLVLFAVPLPLAFKAAYRLFMLAGNKPDPASAADFITQELSDYAGAIGIGFVGIILAGVCLDGLGMRERWYLRSFGFLSFLWLFYFPAGTIFGACALVYLVYKHRSDRRDGQRENNKAGFGDPALQMNDGPQKRGHCKK